MKKRCLSLVFILIALPLVALANAGDDLAQRIQGFQTYQARFVEQTYDQNHQRLQISTGYVWIKRPGLFRWDVETPNQQRIVTDGKYLWVYDLLLQQVTQQPLHQAGQVNPAALLSGDPSDLLKAYTVTRVATGSGTTAYQLKPKDKQSVFTLITMQFTGDQLTGIRVLNTLGQASDFQFTHIKVNSSMSSQHFHFTIPKGVDVLTTSAG